MSQICYACKLRSPVGQPFCYFRCILFLFLGEAEVLAITAVAGNAHVHWVVRNVCRVMEAAGCKVGGK